MTNTFTIKESNFEAHKFQIQAAKLQTVILEKFRSGSDTFLRIGTKDGAAVMAIVPADQVIQMSNSGAGANFASPEGNATRLFAPDISGGTWDEIAANLQAEIEAARGTY